MNLTLLKESCWSMVYYYYHLLVPYTGLMYSDLRPFEVINDSLHPNSITRRVIMRVLCFLRLFDIQGQSLKPSVQIQRYSQINKNLKNKN